MEYSSRVREILRSSSSFDRVTTTWDNVKDLKETRGSRKAHGTRDDHGMQRHMDWKSGVFVGE